MPREVSPRSRRRIPITAELLSAYLDGQVTPEERTAVEQAIAEDPTIAEQARALSQTVALLRALPRAPVPRAFTLSEADVAAAHTPWWERNWRRLAFALYLRGAALVAAVLFVVVVVADLRQGQLPPTTIGAERGLTSAVARDDVPTATAPAGVEGVQPTPFEQPAPGEADLAAASSTATAIAPEAAPAEEAPTEETRLLILPAEPLPTGEVEPPALATGLPTEEAGAPRLVAEPSPTALPAPTQAPLPAEEPLEEEPLAAAPAMGGGLLEPLGQEGGEPVARGGGGAPGAPGLGGEGGMGGGAEGPFDRRPPAFGFAPPPVGGELPAAAAPVSESPTVELQVEDAGVPTRPTAAGPVTEPLVAESPTVEPVAMKASAAEPAAESAMAEAPTAMLAPSPTPTMPPSPTEAPTAESPTVESLAGEAPTVTPAPSPMPTMPPSPTARSASPTPPASPSPAPSAAPMAHEGAATSAAQQAGQAEIGLRFGPWTLTPAQAQALEVALGASVVILLAASWLVRRH
jgi:anti-sigma factor RsiW